MYVSQEIQMNLFIIIKEGRQGQYYSLKSIYRSLIQILTERRYSILML